MALTSDSEANLKYCSSKKINLVLLYETEFGQL